MLARAVALAVACTAIGCDRPAQLAPLVLADGRTIGSEELARGRAAYLRYCVSCHGERGDGRGPSAYGMNPPPRDFTLGQFKFGGVPGGELPTDEALERIVRRGLHGTPMQGWDLPQEDRRAVVQYLKTFSTRWQEEEPGEAILPSADPWAGREADAVRRGRAVYHLMAQDHAGCAGCHPAYQGIVEWTQQSRAVTGLDPMVRADPSLPVLTTSEYADGTLRLLAPDFRFHPLRTVWPLGARVDGRIYGAADQREDLYRVIAAGVGGTAMPTWHGALPEENLWAVAHYLQRLLEPGAP